MKSKKGKRKLFRKTKRGRKYRGGSKSVKFATSKNKYLSASAEGSREEDEQFLNRESRNEVSKNLQSLFKADEADQTYLQGKSDLRNKPLSPRQEIKDLQKLDAIRKTKLEKLKSPTKRFSHIKPLRGTARPKSILKTGRDYSKKKVNIFTPLNNEFNNIDMKIKSITIGPEFPDLDKQLKEIKEQVGHLKSNSLNLGPYVNKQPLINEALKKLKQYNYEIDFINTTIKLLRKVKNINLKKNVEDLKQKIKTLGNYKNTFIKITYDIGNYNTDSLRLLRKLLADYQLYYMKGNENLNDQLKKISQTKYDETNKLIEEYDNLSSDIKKKIKEHLDGLDNNSQINYLKSNKVRDVYLDFAFRKGTNGYHELLELGFREQNINIVDKYLNAQYREQRAKSKQLSTRRSPSPVRRQSTPLSPNSQFQHDYGL